jgi:small subunit ribosomal protein S6
MVRYETLLLTVPEITADEQSALETQFEKTLKDRQATLVSFERWGKFRLAYPVNKNDYGVYYLARFETLPNKVAQPLLADIETLLAVKYNELIARHLISRLDSKKSLTYQRPESLEETPTRDVDSFLKENKMMGLMGRPSRGHASHASLDIEQESDSHSHEELSLES